MCGNTFTVLQVFSYNRLFEGHIICPILLSSSATSSSSHPAAIGSSLHPPVTAGYAATGFSSCLPVKTGSS